ncbi:MAG: succinate dehydrogenase [Armatimonadetes bacterium]|nr:succinate dehydrogenase [Armatimonadota bacterium]
MLTMSVQTAPPVGWREKLKGDNYFLHKLHSLTGIFPVGYYLVQHLFLNSMAAVDPKYFNAVVYFFNEILPKPVLWGMELFLVILPLLFHSLYGFVITYHGKANIYRYRFSENLAYTLQRVSGVYIFVFLIYHVYSTTISHKLYGTDIYYSGMQAHFQNPLVVAFYALGVIASSYHLFNGVWNFAIRWGIVIGDRAQRTLHKWCWVGFVLLSALGLIALAGFFMHEAPAPPVSH